MINLRFSDYIVGFLEGLFLGSLLSVTYLYFFSERNFSLLTLALNWVDNNLGYSIYLFLTICIVYRIIWQKLRYQLRVVSLERWQRIVHYEQILDLLVGLSFGVGVIWTAIGMHAALSSIFSDNSMQNINHENIFFMLDKMINGGIITALTSTIVGASLGYLLRVLKLMLLNMQISQYEGKLTALPSE